VVITNPANRLEIFANNSLRAKAGLQHRVAADRGNRPGDATFAWVCVALPSRHHEELFARIRWIAVQIRDANDQRSVDLGLEAKRFPAQLINTGVRGVGTAATGRTCTGTSACVVPSSPTRIT
jgi:hypothetical protein